MDTCKIAPGIYQYTAMDNCSRYRVLRCYSRRTAANTVDFIDCAVEDMPFPIQRIQTDRGREFFAEKVQKQLMIYGIKFRPNKPASPHLNGKVERAHSSLNGLTPIDRITEISDQTPLSEDVSQNYQIKKERFQEQNYRLDLQLRKLKPSL